MTTCATCKHRGEEAITACNESTDWENAPTTFYECKMATHDKYSEYTPGQRAVVEDGSGYFARLCVENTFGCNKWECKPA